MSQDTNINSAAFSGLPQPFLDAMRRLFNILDKENEGLIHIDGKFW